MPAATEVPRGVAESVKSAKKIERASDAVCPPLVPVIVKFRGFAELAVRPLTVRVLVWPGGTVVGLKVQVAPDPQPSATFPRKELGAEAATLNVAEVLPIRRTLERVLAESVNCAIPVPESVTATAFAALDRILRLPVRLPLPVGLKVIEMVQAWPTLRTSGVVGRFPHVFVCWKSPDTVMELIVTARPPLLMSATV